MQFLGFLIMVLVPLASSENIRTVNRPKAETRLPVSDFFTCPIGRCT
jgi:hypothetical protein